MTTRELILIPCVCDDCRWRDEAHQAYTSKAVLTELCTNIQQVLGQYGVSEVHLVDARLPLLRCIVDDVHVRSRTRI
jgi:hypothetical protein